MTRQHLRLASGLINDIFHIMNIMLSTYKWKVAGEGTSSMAVVMRVLAQCLPCAYCDFCISLDLLCSQCLPLAFFARSLHSSF